MDHQREREREREASSPYSLRLRHFFNFLAFLTSKTFFVKPHPLAGIWVYAKRSTRLAWTSFHHNLSLSLGLWPLDVKNITWSSLNEYKLILYSNVTAKVLHMAVELCSLNQLHYDSKQKCSLWTPKYMLLFFRFFLECCYYLLWYCKLIGHVRVVLSRKATTEKEFMRFSSRFGEWVVSVNKIDW